MDKENLESGTIGTDDLVGRHIGHIRIEAVIGRGGMGEVFLGFDEKLERQVALKTIRRGRRPEPVNRKQFIREARILSKLDHPGICRIHNLIEYTDYDFLVLEYIDGEPLSLLIRRNALLPEQKLAVARGIARALAAAHQAGVAHRDLKPENVMVTESGQVKILDFGLSRLLPTGEGAAADSFVAPDPGEEPIAVRSLSSTDSGSGSGATLGSEHTDPLLTEQGQLAGTLAYMSPEQVRGAPASREGDMYSLGIVLHELFTGKSPYPPDLTPMMLLVQVEQGLAAPVSGVDSELGDLVDRLKLREAVLRPTAQETVEVLDEIAGRPARRRRRRKQIIRAVSMAAVIVLASVLTWLATRGPQTISSPPEGRIAIMPFVDETGQQAWVRTGLRDLATRPLSEMPTAILAPLSQIEDVISANNLEETSLLSVEQVRTIQSSLGAGAVVEAWLRQDDDQYLLAYRISLKNEQIERQLRGMQVSLLAERMARLLAEELRLGSLTTTFREPFLSQMYGVGIHVRRTRGAKAAQPFFEACLALEPDFLRARLQLAQCLSQNGDWSESMKQSQLVLEHAETAGDQANAAAALIFMGGLAGSQADYEAADAYLQRALGIETRRGDSGGQAQAYFQQARMAYAKGSWDEARELLEKTLELERRNLNHPREADTVNYLGLVALNTRQYESARNYFNTARTMAEDYGDPRRRAHALVNLGSVAQHQQQIDEAEALWTEALEALRRTGDRRNELAVLNNLGVLQLNRENYPAAAETFKLQVELSTSLGDTIMEAAAHLNLASALMNQDFLVEARRELDRVMELETWIREDVECFVTRAELAFREGSAAEAVEYMEEARRLSGEDWSENRRRILDRYRRAARG